MQRGIFYPELFYSNGSHLSQLPQNWVTTDSRTSMFIGTSPKCRLSSRMNATFIAVGDRSVRCTSSLRQRVPKRHLRCHGAGFGKFLLASLDRPAYFGNPYNADIQLIGVIYGHSAVKKRLTSPAENRRANRFDIIAYDESGVFKFFAHSGSEAINTGRQLTIAT